MEKDRRSFSRVSTFIRARLRRLPTSDAPYFFNGVPGGQQSLGAEALKESRMSEELVDFLLQLDSKLDTIISHLDRGLIQDDFPLQAEILDISGSGVTFTSAATLKPGEFAEIILILSQFPLRMAGAIGQVQRVEAVEGESASLNKVAFDFVRVREADLETIVQFVFNEERKMIREKKWE